MAILVTSGTGENDDTTGEALHEARGECDFRNRDVPAR
jgi:hypothetical protein